MEESIFMKIINGEVPCHKVYEDEHTFAFLDIHPVTEGHTLVVPKKQVLFVWDMSDEAYAALMRTCKLVAVRLREILPVSYVGSQIVGVDVPHAHVHLIPFSSVAEFRNRPDMHASPDHTALAALAARLAF